MAGAGVHRVDRRRRLLPLAVVAALCTAGAQLVGGPPVATGSADTGSSHADRATSPVVVPAADADECTEPWAWLNDNYYPEAMPGESFQVHAEGFPPGTQADVVWVAPGDYTGEETGDEPDIGTKMGQLPIDETGQGAAMFVVPVESAFGSAGVIVRVAGVPGCYRVTWLEVVRAKTAISISDKTVRPGQRVTVRASGFSPGADVTVELDDSPSGGANPLGRVLGSKPADATGSIVLGVRIPKRIAPGRHFLAASAYDYDEDGQPDDETILYVYFRVLRAPGLPETDTE